MGNINTSSFPVLLSIEYRIEITGRLSNKLYIMYSNQVYTIYSHILNIFKHDLCHIIIFSHIWVYSRCCVVPGVGPSLFQLDHVWLCYRIRVLWVTAGSGSKDYWNAKRPGIEKTNKGKQVAHEVFIGSWCHYRLPNLSCKVCILRLKWSIFHYFSIV